MNRGKGDFACVLSIYLDLFLLSYHSFITRGSQETKSAISLHKLTLTAHTCISCITITVDHNQYGFHPYEIVQISRGVIRSTICT